MFTFVEKITPFKGVYEYDVFKEDIEINYSNILFSIRIYLLESNYTKVENQIDVIVLDKKYFTLNSNKKVALLKALEKEIVKEFCELGVDSNTPININIVEA